MVARFVLRREDSITLSGMEFGTIKKENPHQSSARLRVSYSMGAKGGRWRTDDPRALKIHCTTNVTVSTQPGDILKKIP
jgi:hypothetical protein